MGMSRINLCARSVQKGKNMTCFRIRLVPQYRTRSFHVTTMCQSYWMVQLASINTNIKRRKPNKMIQLIIRKWKQQCANLTVIQDVMKMIDPRP